MKFTGFGKDTVRFLSGLQAHNEKAWFDAHRADYESALIEPAKAFVEAMAPQLRKLDSSIQAEPRVNGSIMRIHRDIRFSKDKSPYKDHLDMFFWSGADKGWESSGFFFRLTPDTLMLGAGLHGFSTAALARYRKAVLDEKRGGALVKLVAKLRKGGYDIGTESYKRTPAGVPQDHARAALLKHGGLHAGWQGPHPRELGSAKLVAFCVKRYAAILPLHEWLREL